MHALPPHRKEELGTLLTSDLIINWLVREKEALDSLTPDKRDALAYTLPKAVLNAEAQRMTHERCYGLNIAGIIKEMAATANTSDAQSQEVSLSCTLGAVHNIAICIWVPYVDMCLTI